MSKSGSSLAVPVRSWDGIDRRAAAEGDAINRLLKDGKKPRRRRARKLSARKDRR